MMTQLWPFLLTMRMSAQSLTMMPGSNVHEMVQTAIQRKTTAIVNSNATHNGLVGTVTCGVTDTVSE